jgi:4-phytase/acid phosphatase
MTCRLCVFAYLLISSTGAALAQNAPAKSPATDSELQYVVYLSRHGVRSPTGKLAQYNQYATNAWPEWAVQPGYLTPHGFHLMELFGAYDRTQLAGEGLLSSTGCSEAAKITIYADSDQRTRETGKALAQGLMPGCNLAVQALPEGTNDPLFHPLGDKSVPRDLDRAKTAVAGRLGGDPANLTRAYRQQLESLDHVLATCGTPAEATPQRTSLFDIPATLSQGSGDHLIDLKGPVNTASTLAENLLLEYTEGMDKAKVGWGCVGRSELDSLMTLHTAATDFTQRTPEIARVQASGLLERIGQSMEQAVSRKPVSGALGKPTDLALFLIGHDTNQENVAGMLNLTWIADGRRDDTPPGGALVFEVWHNRSIGDHFVRAYFTAQTLEQMRGSNPLTTEQVPERVPVFIPGCSGEDMSCDLHGFITLLHR